VVVFAVVWLAKAKGLTALAVPGLVCGTGRVEVSTSGSSSCGSLVGEGEVIDGTGGAWSGLWHWAR
jgi:hypothetical protein